MAKLITTYSKELKEKIFILKGEEGYARTTDTLLDEILHDGERRADWDTHKEYMLVEFRIDVLRDLGASQIVLYDNDEVIGVYDFALGTHSIEFKYTSPSDDTRLKLDYGVEHNLYARYMGNKQCLKSTSKTYSFYEPTPDAFDSSIAFNGLNTNYETGATVSFNSTLTAYQVNNQTLILYVDNEEKDRATTNSNGVASFSVPDLAEGKHTITVEYMGEEYSTATLTTKDISVGYIVEITDYPSYVINAQPSSVTVRVTDYLGVPARKTLAIEEYTSGWGWEIISQSQTTDTDGYATLTPVYITSKGFRATIDNSYHSDTLTTAYYENVSFAHITASPTMVSSGYNSTITGNLINVHSPVTVSLNQDVGDVTTDDMGSFTATYNGSGRGDTTITASVYNASTTVNVEDIVQYWKAPSTVMNQYYEVYMGSITSQSNGWMLTADNNGNFLMNSGINRENCEISYRVVSQTNVTNLVVGAIGTSVSVSAGDRIRLVFAPNVSAGNSCAIYKNGNYATTVSLGRDYNFGFDGNANCRMIIDEFKVKRI